MESETTKKSLPPIKSSPETTPAPTRVSVHRLSRRSLQIIALIVGVVLVAVTSFAFGFSAGIRKARFSYRFGENYERNFMRIDRREMKEKVLKKMDGRLFRSGHGAVGEILSITDRTIALRGPEGQENSIAVTDSTIYNKGGDQVNLEDLTTGDRIVVLGKPSDDGMVVADLIRVLELSADQVPSSRHGLFR